jgi:hypothetical protein
VHFCDYDDNGHTFGAKIDSQVDLLRRARLLLRKPKPSYTPRPNHGSLRNQVTLAIFNNQWGSRKPPVAGESNKAIGVVIAIATVMRRLQMVPTVIL